MSTGFTMVILAQAALLLFLLWGFLHENRFIEFENRIIAVAVRRLKIRMNRRNAEKRRRLNAKVCYTPEKPTAKTSVTNRAA